MAARTPLVLVAGEAQQLQSGDTLARGGATYSADVGDGSTLDVAVAHNLGTTDVSVETRLAASPRSAFDVAWDATDANTVTLHFTPTAPTAAQYRVTVQAGGAAATTGPWASPAAKFIVQQADGSLTGAQALSALATGLVFVTTTTGVLTSVVAPSGAIVGTTDAQTLTNKTLTSPTINGLIGGTARVNAVVASTVTASNATFINVTGLSFAIGASETWTAEFALWATGTTNGVKFQATGPASPTSVRIVTHGCTTAVTAYSTDATTAFSSASGAYCTAISGVVRITLTVVNGANAGTVQLQVASSSTTNAAVLLNSYMTARRVS